MTLRDEVMELFEQARREVASKTTPAGTMPREGDPDLRWVAINANNRAVADALLKIADRVDALETRG